MPFPRVRTIYSPSVKCSYCGHLAPSDEAFHQHWIACPMRIRLGYIEAAINPS